jgi:penicillin-binding protein-related factor A (putative recombinase)
VTGRRGGGLELAIARAARAERKAGRRVVLVRQYPDIAHDRDGSAFYSTGAPVDFIGALDGKAIAIEAKESKTPSLALSRLRDDQRSLMGILHAAGADVRLVIGFTSIAEVYSIAWPEVATFIAFPWRASWSLAWCRAVGEVLPQSDANDPRQRRVHFLDGAPHPQRDEAIATVAGERTKPIASHVEEPIDEATAPAPSPFHGLSTDEIRDRLASAADAGVEHQLHRWRHNRMRFAQGRGR